MGSKPHAWVYQDKQWPHLRKAVMRRDNYTCQICGGFVQDPQGPWVDDTGRTRRRQDHPMYPNVDHIVPLDQDTGLAFEMDNLQLLHRGCHMGAKQRQDKSKRMQRDDGW